MVQVCGALGFRQVGVLLVSVSRVIRAFLAKLVLPKRQKTRQKAKRTFEKLHILIRPNQWQRNAIMTDSG